MKTRIIQTRFWEDSFVYRLNPNAKLLFLYFLTNKRVELTGAYELPLPFISVETLLTNTEVNQSLSELYPKIQYVDGYVVILNHKKYQDYSKGNEKQKGAYEREFEKLPDKVKSLLNGGIELVGNQLVTSSELDIIYKTENRNKKVESRKSEIFKKPKIEEIEAYCLERKNKVEPQKFLSYYESNGWKVGKNPMKNWKAAVRTWEQNTKTAKKFQNENHEAYENIF